MRETGMYIVYLIICLHKFCDSLIMVCVRLDVTECTLLVYNVNTLD